VLFLIDSTNSMKSYLAGVKSQIRDIARDLKLSHPDISLHLSVVAYRDYGCIPRFEVLHFTPNISELEEFLQHINPIISKDTAEDVLGGLAQALEQVCIQRIMICLSILK